MTSELEGLKASSPQAPVLLTRTQSWFLEFVTCQAVPSSSASCQPVREQSSFPDQLFPLKVFTYLPRKHIPSCLNLLHSISPESWALPRSQSPVMHTWLCPGNHLGLGRNTGPTLGEPLAVGPEQDRESTCANTRRGSSSAAVPFQTFPKCGPCENQMDSILDQIILDAHCSGNVF